ncbi:MAG TPA: carboxymuconolactone decarboxylase family protein [Candidatus Binatia bacterium]|nr:carboxymuconolactone decarboxylase family protein [Candidatus Binatia bacterium]
MPFIPTIPPGRATGELADAYGYMRDVAGASMIANIVQVFSLRPASMRRMIRAWELAMWAGDEPRATRELVAAAVSRLNDCHY